MSNICHEYKVQKWPGEQFVFLSTKNHIFGWFLRFSQEPLKISKNKKSVSSLGSQEYTTKISTTCRKQKVQKWPGRAIGTFDFTCRSGVILNPCISATNQYFKNEEKVILDYGRRNVSQKFQIPAMIRKYRCGQAEQLVLLIVRTEVE